MTQIKVRYSIIKDSEELKCKPCAYITLCIPSINQHGHNKLPPEFRIREKDPFTGHMIYLPNIFSYNRKDMVYELSKLIKQLNH